MSIFTVSFAILLVFKLGGWAELGWGQVFSPVLLSIAYHIFMFTEGENQNRVLTSSVNRVE